MKTVSLAERVEQGRKASAEAVDAYVPKVTGRIDALASPAIDILRQLPGVADVKILVSAPKPTHRQVAGRPLSDGDIEKLHQKHLLKGERVRIEQEGIRSRAEVQAIAGG
jgi:hypothetical protein